MDKTELFNSLFKDLEKKLHLLEDKPEESVETTLKALWSTAAGFPISADGSAQISLPELTGEQLEKLYQLIDLRLKNIPLAYITKRQNFMGIELLADERALIPRKETEILGKKALELSIAITESKELAKIIDVCCGSGNLALAIAHYNAHCMVYASDISKEAVELMHENIGFRNLASRVQVKQGNLFSAFESDAFYEKVDLIVCNPPYISSFKVSQMDPEISHNEPLLAFDGGMIGMKVIQQIISESVKFLIPGGWLVFEVGAGQGSFVIQICERAGSYRQILSIPDGNGIVRVIAVQKPPEDQRVLK